MRYVGLIRGTSLAHEVLNSVHLLYSTAGDVFCCRHDTHCAFLCTQKEVLRALVIPTRKCGCLFICDRIFSGHVVSILYKPKRKAEFIYYWSTDAFFSFRYLHSPTLSFMVSWFRSFPQCSSSRSDRYQSLVLFFHSQL